MAAEPRVTIDEIDPGTWRVIYNAPLPLIHHCRQDVCPHRDAPLVSIIKGEKPCLDKEKERAKKLWQDTVEQTLPLDSSE